MVLARTGRQGKRPERIALVHPDFLVYGGAERFCDLMSRELNADVHTVGVRPEALAGHDEVAARLRDHARPPGTNPGFARKVRTHMAAPIDADFLVYTGETGLFRTFSDPTPYLYYCFTPNRWVWGGDLAGDHLARTPAATRPQMVLFMTALAASLQFLHRAAVRADRVAVVSSLVADRYERAYGARPARVIHCPIDASAYQTGTYDEGFLTVNRLEPSKRVDLLIRACARAGERLTVVGDGPQRQALESLAQGLGADVEFAGALHGQRLADAYSRCRALLFAARQEDFGLTPFEAMAAGKPVAAVDEGGFWDLADERTSWKWHDEDALSRLLPRLTPAACAARQAACIETAKQVDAPVIADQLRTMISSIAKGAAA